MRFIILVKSDANAEAGKLPDPKVLEAMGKFNAEMQKAGVMLAGDGLHASSKGARIRHANGKATVIDGPFSEAKELVGGFWLIQTKSKAEALDWLKRAPFEAGEVEIRPLYELDDFPVNPAEQPGGWRDKEQELRETASLQTSRGAKKMRFFSVLMGDKQTEAGVMPEDPNAFAKMGAFIEEAAKAGVYLGGEGLKPTAHGVRIVYDGTRRSVIDGPFTEAKEIVAGYSILAVDSKAEAIEWTKRFAAVDAEIRNIGAVECEIRQMYELEDFSE